MFRKLYGIFINIDFNAYFDIIKNMSGDIFVKAPAKVNIGLKVLERRADGYHDIESIFQTVDLYDELKVCLIPEENVCRILCEDMQLPESNTLTKTYEAFCAATGKKTGVQVSLKKRIPSGGGLGGGSSDAAYFLVALAELNHLELTESLKDEVASKVGSDVFFFLHCNVDPKKGGCALVSGRGEVVQPIDPRADLYFLLIFPDVHSSTKEAYSLVDDAYKAGCEISCPPFEELKSLYSKPVEEWDFANSFTPALVNKYPVIGDALKDIKECGADWAEMSGSGATVFGVFKTELAAKNAVLKCQKKWKCVIAH